MLPCPHRKHCKAARCPNNALYWACHAACVALDPACGRHRRGCCGFRSNYRQARSLLQPCCCRCASPASRQLCPLVRSLPAGWPGRRGSLFSTAFAPAHLIAACRRARVLFRLRPAAVADNLGVRLPDRCRRACTAQQRPAAAAGCSRGKVRAELMCWPVVSVSLCAAMHKPIIPYADVCG